MQPHSPCSPTSLLPLLSNLPQVPPARAGSAVGLGDMPAGGGALAAAVRTQSFDSNNYVELVPIDHGYSLPETLEPVYFEWLHWPQASMPFSAEALAYVAKLDPLRDAEMLRRELPLLREPCIRLLQLTTILIQTAAAAGLTLADIGNMMSRPLVGIGEEPSELERLVVASAEDVAAAAALGPDGLAALAADTSDLSEGDEGGNGDDDEEDDDTHFFGSGGVLPSPSMGSSGASASVAQGLGSCTDSASGADMQFDLEEGDGGAGHALLQSRQIARTGSSPLAIPPARSRSGLGPPQAPLPGTSPATDSATDSFGSPLTIGDSFNSVHVRSGSFFFHLAPCPAHRPLLGSENPSPRRPAASLESVVFCSS